jgi:lactoylglutathione lyase
MFFESMPNLYTSDIDAAIAFYRDGLGFVQTYQFPPEGRPRHVEFRLGHSRLALTTHQAAVENGVQPSEGHASELVVWCDDIDAAVARLTAAGAAVVVEPYDHFARHRRAYLADRDGNWLALVQPHERAQPQPAEGSAREAASRT